MSGIVNSITGKTISLPLIGAVSVPVAIGAAALLYFVFFRKRRVTSVTTRYAK